MARPSGHGGEGEAGKGTGSRELGSGSDKEKLKQNIMKFYKCVLSENSDHVLDQT